MKTETKSTEQAVADALRSVADRLGDEWDRGERSAAIGLDDLREALRSVAEELESK